MKRKIVNAGRFLFPFLVLCGAWEVLVRAGAVNGQVVPAPSAIIGEFYQLLWQKQTLGYHVVSSLYRLLAGYLLAVIAGFAAGSLLGLNRTLRDMFSPVLSLLMAVPTIAWVPVLLITAGLGDTTVIAAIFLGGVFEITYSTMTGIRALNRQQVNAARIMGARRLMLFFEVIVPGSLLYVMPALRLSIGYCWRALVGAEMLAAAIQWGLGRMIYDARFWNDVKIMFVGLVTIGLFGVFFDRLLLKRLEKGTIQKWGMLAAR
jgi:NitT/TauT family transport system permease protein